MPRPAPRCTVLLVSLYNILIEFEIHSSYVVNCAQVEFLGAANAEEFYM